MATREMITSIVNNKDYIRQGFNISATVGTVGKNEKGDVMLVQALLNFFAMGSPNLAEGRIPIKELTGVFNSETASAIIYFQTRFAFQLLSKDGLVHPASFRNRRLKMGGKQMMIERLNFFAFMSSVRLTGNSDHTEQMFIEFPKLRDWVKDV